MEGYFKFSHGVFQNPILRDLSGDSFRIFLFLSSRAWQFPDSTGEVRASYSFIEMNTGVSVAQIKRSLSQMRDLGLIKIVSIDYKKGSTLWISPNVAEIVTRNSTYRKYPPNGHSSAVDLAQKEQS